MRSFPKLILSAILMAFAAFSMPAMAGDPQIDAAKDAKLIGEQVDGYLGAVGSIDPSLRRKLDEINTLRRELYTKIANEEGETLATVARLTGEKLIAKEDAGRLVFDDSGTWKPAS